jgi:hypothetical protein
MHWKKEEEENKSNVIFSLNSKLKKLKAQNVLI